MTRSLHSFSVVRWAVGLGVALSVHAQTGSPSQELTLDEAVRLALEKNPDLATARHRVAAAQAGLEQADAAFWPRVRLGGTYAASDNPVQAFMMTLNQRAFDITSANFNHPDTTDNLNARLLATYPLYNGGRDQATRQAAQLGTEAQEQSAAAVRNDLVFEVTRAFHTIGKARQFVATAAAAVQSMEANLKVASDRVEQGNALKTDRLDAEVRLAEARENLVRARNALAISETIFRNVIGVGESDPITAGRSGVPAATGTPGVRRGSPDPAVPADRQVSPNGPNGDLRSNDGAGSGLSAEACRSAKAEDPRTTDSAIHWNDRSMKMQNSDNAIRQRPEFLTAQKAVAMAERRVRAAQAGHLPRINAFASYDLDSGNARDYEESWLAGVSVELDVFDGFLTRGQVAEARANLAAAQEQLRKLELALQLEVRQAQLNLDDARARLETTAQAAAQAEESRAITRERYAGGLALFSQVLDAETALTAARQRRAAAEADTLIAEAALAKAVGRDWRTQE